jgi:hypothetical protein
MKRRTMLALGLVAACGCSSSSSNGGSSDGGDGGGDGPGGASLSVSVVLGADEAPIPGATVALDLGGHRTEQETDDTGTTVFTGLDFAGGTASVTAFIRDYAAISYLGLAESQGTLQMRTYEVDPSSSSSTVMGTAANLTAGDALVVSATAGRTLNRADVIRPDYSLQVKRSTPFTLVAADFNSAVDGHDITRTVQHWATVDHAGIGGITRVDIDFLADAATPTAVSGTFMLPSRADSPLRTDPYASFGVGSAVATLAAAMSSSTLGADSFAMSGEYLDLGTDIQPITTYTLQAGLGSTTQESSTITAPGYPTDGFTIDNFLDPPEVTSALEVAPVYDKITWIHHDPSTRTMVRVLKPSADGSALLRIWDVWTSGDATSATIPGLPSTADAGDVFGMYPMRGYVAACELDETTKTCTRYGQSKPIELIPP